MLVAQFTLEFPVGNEIRLLLHQDRQTGRPCILRQRPQHRSYPHGSKVLTIDSAGALPLPPNSSTPGSQYPACAAAFEFEVKSRLRNREPNVNLQLM
jgi:hypothetical protein